MRCGSVRKMLGPYFDGELPQDKAEDVRRHLSSCFACAEELRTLQAVEQMVLMAAVEEPAEDSLRALQSRLESRIEAEKPRSEKRRAHRSVLRWIIHPYPRWRLAGAVASAALVAVFVLALWQREFRHQVMPSSGLDYAARSPSTLSNVAPGDSVVRLSKGAGKFALPRGSNETSIALTGSRSPLLVLDEFSALGCYSVSSPGMARIQASKHNLYSHSASDAAFLLSAGDPERIYALGLFYQDHNQPHEAKNQFELIVTNHSRSDVADNAQFQLNEHYSSFEDVSDETERWRSRREMWQAFLDRYPTTDLKEEARWRLAESWYYFASASGKPEDLREAMQILSQTRAIITGGERQGMLRFQIDDLKSKLTL